MARRRRGSVHSGAADQGQVEQQQRRATAAKEKKRLYSQRNLDRHETAALRKSKTRDDRVRIGMCLEVLAYNVVDLAACTLLLLQLLLTR